MVRRQSCTDGFSTSLSEKSFPPRTSTLSWKSYTRLAVDTRHERHLDMCLSLHFTLDTDPHSVVWRITEVGLLFGLSGDGKKRRFLKSSVRYHLCPFRFEENWLKRFIGTPSSLLRFRQFKLQSVFVVTLYNFLYTLWLEVFPNTVL